MNMEKVIFLLFLVSIFFAVFVSPFASPSPDGLEKVAEYKGVISVSGNKGALKSPLPDYSLPGIENKKVSIAISGFIGTVFTFSIALGFGYILKKKG